MVKSNKVSKIFNDVYFLSDIFKGIPFFVISATPKGSNSISLSVVDSKLYFDNNLIIPIFEVILPSRMPTNKFYWCIQKDI